MEWVVLGLLIFGEMTIYELNNAFRRGLSLIYSASYGNLQFAVKKLLKKGMISFEERVEHGRNKKIYSINDEGRKAFFDWMYSEISTAKLETVVLSKIYFLGLIPESDKREAIIQEMISRTEEVKMDLQHMDKEYSSVNIPEEYRTIAEYQLKTLDYGIMAHTAALEWLAELLKQELASDSGSPD